MRIGIDASTILQKKTGIGNYTYYLLKNLLSIDDKNQYVIFLNSYRHKLAEYPFLKNKNVKVVKFNIPGPFLIRAWRYLKFPPIDFLIGKIDVFHSPASYIPPQIRGLKVTTIHDLYFLRNPEKCEKSGGQFFNSTIPKLINKIDKIIVPSFFTKQELTDLLKIPEEKICVIYEGVDNSVFGKEYNEQVISGMLKEYCLPSNYLLSVGTIEPRKNIEGLLFAYRRLHEIMNNPPKLVIVGRKGLDGEKIIETATQLNMQKNIIFTGYIPDEHLPILYKNALLFIYPSFYEGFGLPVLEAMISKVPVIISNNAVHREIVGNAGVFFDPDNYYQMAELIRELITSYKLRNEFRDKGFELASRFTWELTAKKTLKVYEELFESKKK